MEIRKKSVKRLAMTVVGNLIYAMGINLMINPIHLYSSGFTGISQLLRMFLIEVLHVPQIGGLDYMGIIYFLLNIPLFLLAYKVMGRKFCITTLGSIAMASVFLAIIPVPKTPIVDDRILAAVVGGLGSAVAELLASHHPAPIEFVGMKDCFGKSGSYEELSVFYGLDSIAIDDAVKTVIARK